MKKLNTILTAIIFVLSGFSFGLFVGITETEARTTRGFASGLIFFILILALILLVEKGMKE